MKELFLTLIELLMNLYEKIYIKNSEMSRTIENLKLKKNLYMKRVKQVQRVIIDFEEKGIEDHIMEFSDDVDWYEFSDEIHTKIIKFHNIFPDKFIVLGEMKAGSEMAIHRHSKEQEEIYMISGSITDLVTDLTTVSGESYFITADSPHHIIANEDSCLIATFTNVE